MNDVYTTDIPIGGSPKKHPLYASRRSSEILRGKFSRKHLYFKFYRGRRVEMRLLKFNVNAQTIQKDPDCDFEHIVAGTKGYLKAQFTFSPEWYDCILVASFWRGKNEHAVFIQNGECMIPPDALIGPTFRVSVVGQRGDYRITTNKILVRQEVSR